MARSAGARVAIIEDSPELVRLFEAVLQGHADLVCHQRDFLELLQPEPWEGVDAALVDYMLPEITGLTICSYVRANFPHIRLVMLSAHPFARREAEGLVDACLTKPQDVDSLLSALGLK